MAAPDVATQPPKSLEAELRDAAIVALAVIRGELSPSVAEHALTEALERAGVGDTTRTEGDEEFLDAQWSGLERLGERL